MKRLSLILVAATALALPAVSMAQWQWVDRSGHKVFSDQPPPPDIPQANIVKRPGGRSAPAAAAAAATAPVANAQPAAPTLTRKDKELEANRKKAEAAEAEKKQQAEAERQAARADNCARAKQAKSTYDSGVRVMRTNQKTGEREYVSDDDRAKEVKRLEAVIARDCSQPGQQTQ
jgi:hypothetical protein